jgi:hypothetical protein
MATPTTCGVAGCRGPARYAFASAGHAPQTRCRWHGLVYPPVCGRAIRVALVVGTILVAINQSDVLLGGHLTALVAAKIGLTYLVPFSVATYSALAANQLHDG